MTYDGSSDHNFEPKHCCVESSEKGDTAIVYGRILRTFDKSILFELWGMPNRKGVFLPKKLILGGAPNPWIGKFSEEGEEGYFRVPMWILKAKGPEGLESDSSEDDRAKAMHLENALKKVGIYIRSRKQDSPEGDDDYPF